MIGPTAMTDDAAGLLRAVVEGAFEGVVVTDTRLDEPGPTIVYVNRAFCEMTGYEPEEVLGRNPRILQGPLTERDVMTRLRSCLERGAPFEGEAINYRKDGSTFRLEWRVLPIRDAAGAITHYFAVQRDVTEERNAEEKLRRAALMYRGLVEQIPAVAYIWEAEEHLEAPAALENFDLGYYTSPRIEELIGYTRQEYDDQPYLWKELVHPDDRDRVYVASEHTERTGEPFDEQYRIRHRDGHYVWIHDVASLFLRDDSGSPWLLQGVMLDVTDRMEAERALRMVDERYRSLVRNMPAVVYVESVDGDPERFYISPQIETLTGYTPERFEDPSFWETIVHPDDVRRVVHEDVRLAGTVTSYREEYRLRTADGRDVWVLDEGLLLDGTGDRPVWQGVMLDVSDRKAAEESLRDTLERFRALAANVPVGIFQTTVAGGCFYVNERWSEITGMPFERAQGSGWADALHPDDRDGVLRAWNEAAAAGGEFGQEYRFLLPDGAVRWVLGSATAVRDARGTVTGYLGTISDISEQKRAEAYLRSSVKDLAGSLDALRNADRERRDLLNHLVQVQEQERAALAEDIIDDPIQKMAAIGMRLETLRTGLSDPQQLGAIDQLGSAVEQATDRLRSVLFELRPRALDQDGLTAALRAYLKQAVHEDAPRWDVEDRLLVEPPQRLRAVAYRIAQEAISNVLDHAKATHLTVTVESREDWLILRIADDGVGIDAAAQPGSDASPPGLGITGMLERARLEGGSMRVDGAHGRGTTVEVRLPMAADDASVPVPGDVPPPDP
ncbi:MAG: PAS domain-containing protein [Actinomycetota bacterium]